MANSTQNRSFQRRSSQPISWHSTEETKSNTTNKQPTRYFNLKQKNSCECIKLLTISKQDLTVDIYRGTCKLTKYMMYFLVNKAVLGKLKKYFYTPVQIDDLLIHTQICGAEVK